MKSPLLYSVLPLCLLVTGVVHALDIDDASSAQNDRFANDSGFVLEGYDLSGIGRSNGSSSRWAALVSRNVFVSANHFRPSLSSTITFYKTNDPNGPSVTIGVKSGQRIADSDIWVGVLDEPVPPSYATYSFATTDITSQRQFDRSIYSGLNAFLVGQSPFNNFSGNQDFAVGRNRLTGLLLDVDSVGTIDDALFTAIEDDSADVQFETRLVSGDSGAPLLVDLDEEDDDLSLQIIGTNWFIGQVGPPTTDVNGFTYLGNYDEQIQAIIDDNPVVEPPPAAFAAAHLAYRDSQFDATSNLAIDKTPLLNGQTASFQNYSSYTRGINRVVIDIQDLPFNGSGLSASDFVFRVGNDNTPSKWADAPAPTAVTVRPGEGSNDSDRIIIDWADNAIQNQWLQVTILATEGTALPVDFKLDAGVEGKVASAQFYFGNARFEGGTPSSTHAEVNFFDAIGPFRNQSNDAPITSPFDYDRDGDVDFFDAIGAFRNQASEVLLITPPGPAI